MTDEQLALMKARAEARPLLTFDGLDDETRQRVRAAFADRKALVVDQEAWRSVGRAVKKLEFNLPADAMGRHYCPWCHWSEEGNLDEHEADCPLKIIPALLGG